MWVLGTKLRWLGLAVNEPSCRPRFYLSVTVNRTAVSVGVQISDCFQFFWICARSWNYWSTQQFDLIFQGLYGLFYIHTSSPQESCHFHTLTVLLKHDSQPNRVKGNTRFWRTLRQHDLTARSLQLSLLLGMKTLELLQIAANSH